MLADVKQLFAQFEAADPSVDGLDQFANRIDSFEGFMVDIKSLRGVLSRRGYHPGPVEDGPTVYEFVKRFPSCGIESYLGFSGCVFPFEDDTVALTGLRFFELDNDWSTLRLSDVPPVLVAECLNDMRLAAAKGTGFDPDWERKTNRWS